MCASFSQLIDKSVIKVFPFFPLVFVSYDGLQEGNFHFHFQVFLFNSISLFIGLESIDQWSFSGILALNGSELLLSILQNAFFWLNFKDIGKNSLIFLPYGLSFLFFKLAFVLAYVHLFCIGLVIDRMRLRGCFSRLNNIFVVVGLMLKGK